MSITNEKLQIIKDNVSKVYRSGQMDVIKNANSLKGFESNKVMLLDDVSPVTHDMGVKVRSKNLFDYSVLENAGYITVNDRLTGEFVFKKVNSLPEVPIPAKEKTSYYVSGYMKGVTEGQNVSCAAYYTDGSNTNFNATTVLDSYVRFSGVTRTDKTLSYIKFGASGGIKMGTSFKNVQVELNSETAYTPYVPDLTAVKVSRCGKNLFNQYAESKFIYPYRGIVVSDFCNNVNSAMYTLSVSLKQGATFQEGINFGLIRMNNSNGSSARWFQTKTDTNFRLTYTNMNSLDHIPDFYVALVGIYPSTEDNWNRIINNYNIQIEYGKPPTDYEPYKECADYTPNADGTVNGVTSLYPNTTLMTDTEGVVIYCNYYKDIDKAYNKLSAEIALSGGE